MSSKKKLVGTVKKSERFMIEQALRWETIGNRAPFVAAEPAELRKYDEAYAIEQAEQAARRLRAARKAAIQRVPAQKSGDSMAGLQTRKKAV